MPRDVSHLGADLTKRAANIDTAIKRGARDIVVVGARVAKDAQLEVMTVDAGGERRLSRVRSGKGAAIGARYELRGDTANIRATGPVPLIANRIKPHQIPKPGRRRKRLAIPSVGVRASVHHPGTTGKDTWNRGRERAEPRIKTAVARKSDEVVRKAFRSGG